MMKKNDTVSIVPINTSMKPMDGKPNPCTASKTSFAGSSSGGVTFVNAC